MSNAGAMMSACGRQAVAAAASTNRPAHRAKCISLRLGGLSSGRRDTRPSIRNNGPGRGARFVVSAQLEANLTAEQVAQEIEQLRAENAALRLRLGLPASLASPAAKEPGPSRQPSAASGAAGSARPAAPAAPAVAASPSYAAAIAAGQAVASATTTVEVSAGEAALAVPSGDGSRRRGRQIEKSANPLSIVFVSSEVAPWSKTGGLGDVAGSLPIALVARGHRVMVVAPRYITGDPKNDAKYAGAFDCSTRKSVFLYGATQEVAYFHQVKDGVDWIFVDHPSYHRPGTPYGDSRGPFGDNMFRFVLLTLAACEAPLVLTLGGSPYGQDVCFIANDWHAALVPVYVAAKYRPHGVFKNARCIVDIHNLAHQGVDPATEYGNLALPPEWYTALEWVFPPWARRHALDKGEAINCLKGALVTADRIVTVSAGYAYEICTAEGGFGLEGLITGRKAVLNGITNGIDEAEWSPAADPHLAASYSVEDMSGKAACKAALQKELGLPVNPTVPLIGFIGRLDWQKGPDMILEKLGEILAMDTQLIMLGSGVDSMEKWMQTEESRHGSRFRGWVGFSVPVAHRMTAGCDILLMPSRFEPCGLNQLYAMQYGTVPVVHATGGLRDTVTTFNPFAKEHTGTGWTFSPATGDAMVGALRTALDTYRKYPEAWKHIQAAGMTADFSWDKAAAQYEQVLRWALVDKPYCT